MANLFDLTGKVAIVTGASRGIGQAIAERYAEQGAKVVMSSRKQEGLDVVAQGITEKGGTALAIAAHNGQKEALQGLVQAAVEAFGRVDILVNNAATNPHFGTLLEAEDSLWQKTIEVNIMGNVWLTQAVVKHMKAQGGGKIINVASINGLRPGRMQGIYSMTKAAMINLTQTLAMELGSENIQVNAIAPGLVQTKFASAIWANEDLLGEIVNRTPVGRIGQPDDIAGMAVYLASGASGFATGQVFVVDGGVTLGSI
ncbi:MAG: glucose 1-dehydrogenase [Chloroflexi bacterium]|nr:glucose 1-dehydrogenase [Chloroflexota bacterium]MCC6892455.1 glucose 1-dehydrogenase [Anaerolineae bacterium]